MMARATMLARNTRLVGQKCLFRSRCTTATTSSASPAKPLTPEGGADEMWVSTDTQRPGLKNPSNVKALWYGPSWWDAGDGPKIHDQDLIPETAGQRQLKLATMLGTGLIATYIVLEADFGEKEHCFSPVQTRQAALDPCDDAYGAFLQVRRVYVKAKEQILTPKTTPQLPPSAKTPP